MAAPTFFVISPSTLLSVIGLFRGPKPTPPPVQSDWQQQLRVRVIIPAFNEESTIALCLDSLFQQTLQPMDVLLIDDGSSDRTVEIAHKYCEANGVVIRIVRRGRSLGKTAGVRRESEDERVDVEFVLDADTVLESPDYLARCVEELYRVPGLASACGLVVPLRERDIRKAEQSAQLQSLAAAAPDTVGHRHGWFGRLLRGVTNIYREALYYFIQNVIYRGEQNLFGSINNPVGCAVAYRRAYLKQTITELAMRYGDNLTTSEDIFFGLAFVYRGYRNVQVYDVQCRSMEPPLNRLPRQLLLWSSAWFQSLWYLPKLLLSPFLATRRFMQRNNRKARDVRNLRKVEDPYRWPWGEAYSRRYGRPIGWSIFMTIFEKVAFPITLVVLIYLQWWEVLVLTVLCELALYVALVALFGKDQRWNYIWKGIVAAPIRYFSIVLDLVTMSRFAFDGATGLQSHWKK